MLQLEKKQIEYGGQSYEVCCNMKVLEALQDKYGSMKAVFEADVNTVSTDLFLIMLSRVRAKRGEEPVTLDDIAEEYNPAMIEETDVFGMFLRAMSAKAAHRQQDQAAGTVENAGKN